MDESVDTLDLRLTSEGQQHVLSTLDATTQKQYMVIFDEKDCPYSVVEQFLMNTEEQYWKPEVLLDLLLQYAHAKKLHESVCERIEAWKTLLSRTHHKKRYISRNKEVSEQEMIALLTHDAVEDILLEYAAHYYVFEE